MTDGSGAGSRPPPAAAARCQVLDLLASAEVRTSRPSTKHASARSRRPLHQPGNGRFGAQMTTASGFLWVASSSRSVPYHRTRTTGQLRALASERDATAASSPPLRESRLRLAPASRPRPRPRSASSPYNHTFAHSSVGMVGRIQACNAPSPVATAAPRPVVCLGLSGARGGLTWPDRENPPRRYRPRHAPRQLSSDTV